MEFLNTSCVFVMHLFYSLCTVCGTLIFSHTFPNPILCLPLVHTAARVILLQYVIAACPLVFIVVTYIWIRWYNNGYRFVVCTTRPVHQLLARFWLKFKIHPSLIDTYAALMFQSFMRFLDVSIKLFHLAILDTESESNNKVTNVSLCIVAVMCLLVFIVPPIAGAYRAGFASSISSCS